MKIGSDSCSKHIGGVSRVELLLPSDIAEVRYSARLGGYLLLALADGCEPTELCFSEGGALWRERLRGSEGAVAHHLECRLRGEQAASVEALGRLCASGVVAIVTTPTGERFLVGYSPEAASDYPLRLTAVTTDSGSDRGTAPQTTVLLESIDGWFSKPLL